MPHYAQVVYCQDVAEMQLQIVEHGSSAYIMDTLPIQESTDYVARYVARVKLRTYAEMLGYAVL
jgi:hypothetical protein